MAGSCRTVAKSSAAESHLLLESNRKWTRTSPPLRDPGRVGSTSRRRARVASAPERTEASTRSRCSSSMSRSRVTLYIAEPVDIVGGCGYRPGPLRNQFADLRPPFAQCRVRPALPRHLPHCLCAGQRPGDGDGIGLILEPDRGTDENVAQRHAARPGAGRVLGQVAVDELPGTSGPGHHPVDDEYPTASHAPTVAALRDLERVHSRPSGEPR